MSKETITLDNFADFHGEVHGVEIKSNLPLEPYVPSSEINVHLGRIGRAAHFGHLGSLAFRRYSEQDSITPGVDSVSEDGSATASFSASASKAPRIDPAVNIHSSPLFNKGSGTVKINLGHEDLNDINLREAKLWANYLDTTMGESIRACSNRKLLSSKTQRAIFASLYLLWPVIDLSSHDVGKAIADYAINIGWFTSIAIFFGGKNGEFTSLIPGFPLDRMGLVQAYTRTHKLVETK